MTISLPELCLVVLIGPSGSGKSTFAAKHFKATEVLSSDFCRGLVSDDMNDQGATKDAFEVLHYIAAKRLAAGRLTVVDATNVQPEARKPLLELARDKDCLPIAIVFNIAETVCLARNRQRVDRQFGAHVVRQQAEQLRRSLRSLRREGFRHIFVLNSPEEVDAVVIERTPLWTNLRQEHGPLDIIGDVHGCFDELLELLIRLGYQVIAEQDPSGQNRYLASHPTGRKAVFLGDLVDRGPRTPDVLKLVIDMVKGGVALCVPGNHESKLLRKLAGRDVQVTHGLAESLEQLGTQPEAFRQEVVAFLDGLVSHYVLDDGKLVVAHAGLKEEFQGRASARVRDFCLYGETTGETDEFGLPVRWKWAAEYRGRAIVVYGHTPVAEPEWLNRTVNIDTGCVFGGKLTALRYPEKELVSVPAARVYYQPAKPLASEHQSPSSQADTRPEYLLDIEDVLGKRIVETRLRGRVTVREENAAAALEVMSRFAVDPRWLIYLPPTMAPCDTAKQGELLEHPAEAFNYFLRNGVPQVVCQEKHMGSRAVVIVGRHEAVVRGRFGVSEQGFGVCYTRTGRRFFEEATLEAEFLGRVRSAVESAGIWTELGSDWIALDCELMPWSAKAQELLQEQYASVGAASRAALEESINVLQRLAPHLAEVGPVLDRYRAREEMVTRYIEAYRRYCWPVRSIADLKLAPFHLLATEGKVHTDKNHLWHMEMLMRLCRADPALFQGTRHRSVNLNDSLSVESATRWWEELTASGGEGMVVKPLEFITRGKRGLVQPAIKCRGPEYLRLIYGPEYNAPESLERLRDRNLAAKYSLALREFALGIEGLERFVHREPLHRIHECAFAVLALESEPVDPRL